MAGRYEAARSAHVQTKGLRLEGLLKAREYLELMRRLAPLRSFVLYYSFRSPSYGTTLQPGVLRFAYCAYRTTIHIVSYLHITLQLLAPSFNQDRVQKGNR